MKSFLVTQPGIICWTYMEMIVLFVVKYFQVLINKSDVLLSVLIISFFSSILQHSPFVHPA